MVKGMGVVAPPSPNSYSMDTSYDIDKRVRSPSGARNRSRRDRRMRLFHVIRAEDLTGVSGTGIVAEGVRFSDYRVIIHWMGKLNSLGIYRNIDELIAIHGHEGRTTIKWLDQE